MPELPEVETTRRGIAPHVQGETILGVEVRQSRLRWPVPAQLAAVVKGQLVRRVHRRGKYLLLELPVGHILLHLGMSGSLRLVAEGAPVGKHDHLDFLLSGGRVLRLNDPRRFGAALWCEGDPMQHPLLINLGPEPLSDDFTGGLLYRRSRGRRAPVKTYIMDSRIVVGVGNIYANEALFEAGIDPRRAAGRIGAARYQVLADRIQAVLSRAIEQGGTTLRDFVGGDGKPGYFQQSLKAYGRGGAPCQSCATPLQEVRLGQRATVFCPRCQR
ncbi:bifunctional DNA-formamidopyrimidine glycosylase/DNA-(apurinic or apyrimidinic site) lyase [Motiliproteus sp. SC1-56]|uniref:bifunctional DNA-formamidopyrimidine glycosylase/DNA-(apurinic or apyrimidinic site) lyase n=1 Tax=Motiliproteus sp. SC1-56 TaxID=2799565 RepID=UPI001A8C0FD3|nr:bifunctional DNA-formamidopyrimidine glycosylase/DNA-(apurinic or apyrimidinic site) lyase [Motiliproteus sp. SC1-56]